MINHSSSVLRRFPARTLQRGLCLLALLVPGCSFLQEGSTVQSGSSFSDQHVYLSSQPIYTVSIHALPTLDTPESEIIKADSFFDGTVQVVDKSLIDYTDISLISASERPGEPGFYNLCFEFTPEGRARWDELSRSNENRSLAILIDGVFYRAFKPRIFYSSTTQSIMVDGPFDCIVADKIQYYSRFNYQKHKKQEAAREKAVQTEERQETLQTTVGIPAENGLNVSETS